MHEIQEQIEHASHAAHEVGPASRLPQWIGITIAILGVLMALCSAQLGAARTELVATMVEENGAKDKYTAVSNKYRSLQAQLQQLHAQMPNLDFHKNKNSELKKLESQAATPDTKLTIQAAHLHTEKILNTVTPTQSDVERFLSFLNRTRAENEAAKHWSESYHDAIQAHANTAERFEVAMLAAEVGIVIASVGLLLARQKKFALAAWGMAILLGAVSLTVASITKMNNAQLLHEAEHKIQQSEHHFASMNRDEEDVAEDKRLENDIIKEMEEIKKLSAGS